MLTSSYFTAALVAVLNKSGIRTIFSSGICLVFFQPVFPIIIFYLIYTWLFWDIYINEPKSQKPYKALSWPETTLFWSVLSHIIFPLFLPYFSPFFFTMGSWWQFKAAYSSRRLPTIVWLVISPRSISDPDAGLF